MNNYHHQDKSRKFRLLFESTRIFCINMRHSKSERLMYPLICRKNILCKEHSMLPFHFHYTNQFHRVYTLSLLCHRCTIQQDNFHSFLEHFQTLPIHKVSKRWHQRTKFHQLDIVGNVLRLWRLLDEHSHSGNSCNFLQKYRLHTAGILCCQLLKCIRLDKRDMMSVRSSWKKYSHYTFCKLDDLPRFKTLRASMVDTTLGQSHSMTCLLHMVCMTLVNHLNFCIFLHHMGYTAFLRFLHHILYIWHFLFPIVLLLRKVDTMFVHWSWKKSSHRTICKLKDLPRFQTLQASREDTTLGPSYWVTAQQDNRGKQSRFGLLGTDQRRMICRKLLLDCSWIHLCDKR